MRPGEIVRRGGPPLYLRESWASNSVRSGSFVESSPDAGAVHLVRALGSVSTEQGIDELSRLLRIDDGGLTPALLTEIGRVGSRSPGIVSAGPPVLRLPPLDRDRMAHWPLDGDLEDHGRRLGAIDGLVDDDGSEVGTIDFADGKFSSGGLFDGESGYIEILDGVDVHMNGRSRQGSSGWQDRPLLRSDSVCVRPTTAERRERGERRDR